MRLLLVTLVIAMLSSPWRIATGSPGVFYAPQQGEEHLRIELTPLDLIGNGDERRFVVGSKVRLKVTAKNDSDQRIMVIITDSYYQNRPRLYRDDKLVPYRSQITKLVQSRDSRPVFVTDPSDLFVEPYSSVTLPELDMSEWYGPLPPGSYRLIDRYRFNFEGPWSADSAPVLFQVMKQ
jgi:hypothetical protein